MEDFKNDIIVESGLLFDIDLAVIKFIRANLADPSFFNLDTLSLPDSSIIGILQEREDKNPLSIIVNEDVDKESMDNIYHQLLVEKMEDIYSYYVETTPVFEFILNCSVGDYSNNILIVCDETDPIDDIKKSIDTLGYQNIYTVKISDKEKIDTKDYSSMYLKYIDNINRYKDVDMKNIYISDLLCNLEKTLYEKNEKVPKMEYFIPLSEHNEIRVFSMYDYTEDNYPVG